MLVMSDLFNQSNGMLVRNPLRDNPVLPLIKLGAEFKKVSDFLGPSRALAITAAAQRSSMNLLAFILMGRAVSVTTSRYTKLNRSC